MRTKFVGLLLSSFTIVSCTFCQEKVVAPLPAPAVAPANDAIFSAFQLHPVVALGDYHGLAQEEDFYAALIRDPRFASEVGNVVVEFGDVAQQATIDRYLAGENIPYVELRKVWSDTVGWFPTVTSIGYLNFFATVRQVNAKLAPAQQIHVWLGDPPVDWSKVKTDADLPRTSRDETPSDILIREILGRKKKALILYGTMHFYGHGSIRERVEQHYPGAFYVLHPYTGFIEKTCSREIEKNFATAPEPLVLSPVKATSLEPLLHAPGCHFTSTKSVMFPPGYTDAQKAHTLAEMEDRSSGLAADALLYLGPAASLTRSADSPDLYLDETYREEIARRIRIMAPGVTSLPGVDRNPVSPRHLHAYGND